MARWTTRVAVGGSVAWGVHEALYLARGPHVHVEGPWGKHHLQLEAQVARLLVSRQTDGVGERPGRNGREQVSDEDCSKHRDEENAHECLQRDEGVDVVTLGSDCSETDGAH